MCSAAVLTPWEVFISKIKAVSIVIQRQLFNIALHDFESLSILYSGLKTNLKTYEKLLQVVQLNLFIPPY